MERAIEMQKSMGPQAQVCMEKLPKCNGSEVLRVNLPPASEVTRGHLWFITSTAQGPEMLLASDAIQDKLSLSPIIIRSSNSLQGTIPEVHTGQE